MHSQIRKQDVKNTLNSMKTEKNYQIYRNVWDAMRTMFIMRFITLNVNVRKWDWSQINNLGLHLRKLEKDQIKFKASSRIKKKIRTEIS